MTLSNEFVSEFAAWAAEVGYPLRVRRRLPAVLRRVPDAFRDSDERRTLFVRSLPNEHNLRVRVETSTHGLYTSDRKLVFFSVGPSWNIGAISKDEDTARLVKDFLFFAEQYVLRSRILRATCAVALSYGALYDFRRADVHRITYGPGSFVTSLSAAREMVEQSLPAEPVAGRGRRARDLRGWMARLNLMDPFVQRAVFQYWRAMALWQADFGEDTITALDGISAVATDAMKCWRGSKDFERDQLASALGLPAPDQLSLARLYQLRCLFGAHPAASKWWDFSEIYATNVETFSQTALRLLGALGREEERHRSVDPDPASWASWFEDNASTLLEAVWFTRLP